MHTRCAVGTGVHTCVLPMCQRGVALGGAERWPVSIWALQRFQPTKGNSRTIMSSSARRWSMLAAVCGSHERTRDSMLFSGLFTQLSLIGTSQRRARTRATRNRWASFHAITTSSSEERRVGKGGGRTGISRWSRVYDKKKQETENVV